MINRAQVTGPLGWSVAAILITAIVVLSQMPPLLAALVTAGAAKEDAVTVGIQKVVLASQKLHAAYKDRFNGRFLFFPPKAPVTAPVAAKRTEEHVPAPVAVVDSSYSGPLSVMFAIDKVVWFKDQTKDPASGQIVVLSPGQESNGVTLVSINPPWMVRVKWHDKEWDLEQFKDWRKAEDLLSIAAKSAAQPAAPISGVTVTPPDRSLAPEPMSQEPQVQQQPESNSDPAPEAKPATVEPSPASAAATAEPTNGAP
jgi:hypothetical protein